MSNLPQVNSENFQAEVLSADKPVLVDFGAVWCGPCKMLDPVVEQLAGEWQSKMKVVKVDVDHNPEIAMQYQVMGVPALILFKNGQPVERIVGFRPKGDMEKKILPHLA